MLTPEWQKLANDLKKIVKIAYWDTEQGANTPALLGPIKGTPTIKFITPSKSNSAGVYKKKLVQDYQGAREVGPMKEYAEANMPSSVDKIGNIKEFDQFVSKANKYALPILLSFSDKAPQPMLKAVSTEYRRRILIGHVQKKSSTQTIFDKFSVSTWPRVFVLENNQPIVLEKKITYNTLENFISKYALKKPVNASADATPKARVKEGTMPKVQKKTGSSKSEL